MAQAQTLQTNEDTPKSGTPAATDPESDHVTFALVDASATNGTVTLDSETGAFTFTPAANFSGTASFKFTATDGSATSAQTTVTIDVAAANEAPVAEAQRLQTSEDTAVQGTLTATDFDSPDVDFAIVANSEAGGTVTDFAPETGAFTFTPTTNFSGQASFRFTARDGSLSSTEQTVTIDVGAINDAPVSGGVASASGSEDAASIGGTVPAASDVDDTALTFALVAGSVKINGVAADDGAVTFGSNGAFSYTPVAADQGLDTGKSKVITFDYVATDGEANSAPATVTVTVNGVNDPPALAGDGAITVSEGGVVVVTTADLTAADVDSTNAELVYTVTATAHGTILRSGTALQLGETFTQGDLSGNLIEFHHDGGEANGSFTVSLTDGSAAAQSRTINAAVTPVNDDPVLAGDLAITVAEGGRVALRG